MLHSSFLFIRFAYCFDELTVCLDYLMLNQRLDRRLLAVKMKEQMSLPNRQKAVDKKGSRFPQALLA